MEDSNVQSGNLHLEVIAIASGEAHNLALTGDGKVYSWGRGTFGRIGTGKEADELLPVLVEFGSDELVQKKSKFVGIAAGAYHSLALADDGSIWCWGYNSYGQLGVDGENLSVPHLLEQFTELSSPKPSDDTLRGKSKAPLKVCSIKAGGMSSFAIDNLGTLWMWGNCHIESNRNDGKFSFLSSSTPIPVWYFHGHIVVKVACGTDHVISLVSSGEFQKTGDNLLCYSWGHNNHGQLGQGDRETRSQPELLKTFDDESHWSVYEIACGSYHTALLTCKRRQSDTLESLCWTFGLGENGQLGHGTTQTILSPESVKDLPQNIFLISIDCGLFHTSVVSSAGCVWSWGMEKGLGLCPDASFTGTDGGDAISPLIIPNHAQNTLKFSYPIQIACGAAHTILVSDNGYNLWSWGRGSDGALGNGSTANCFAPTLVSWPVLSKTCNKDKRVQDEGGEPIKVERDKNLALAMEEMTLLRSKLTKIEQYASILHGSIFGKPFKEQNLPVSLGNSGNFDIGKEWENMLESANHSKLVQLEMFYRNMLAGVKDKMMKKRIQEIVKECLHSQGSTTANLS